MLTGTGNALLLLINTIIGLYTIAVMLRFIIQTTGADPYNQIAQFLIHITDPPLQALRRIFPRYRNVDTAAIVLMVILSVVTVELDLFIVSFQAQTLGAVTKWSLLRLVVLLCNLYFFTTLVEALLSWFNPGRSPATVFLWGINQPVLRPIRRYIPPLGGLDLSPLVVLIITQVIINIVPLPGIFR